MRSLAALVLMTLLLIGGLAATASFAPSTEPCAAYERQAASDSFKNCMEADSARRVAVFTEQLAQFTGLLVLFTVAVAAAGFWQATIGMRQAALAERSMRDLERPYVFPESFLIARPDATKNFARLTIALKNYGRTPATITRLIIGATIEREGGALSDEIFQPMAKVLGPNDTYQDIEWRPQMLQSTFPSIQNGAARLRTRLTITYEDATGQNSYTQRLRYVHDPKAEIFIRDD